MIEITELASLLEELNSLGEKISRITDRPATRGHTGEFIASHIFNIELEESASNEAIDGYFKSGELKGKSVNIKWYGKQEAMLDITPDSLPDFYLVMAGPKSQLVSSRGSIRPWTIDNVYLFDAKKLVESLKKRGVNIGIASSVRKQQWREAQIYPKSRNRNYTLNPDQKQMLSLFRKE